MASCSCHLGGYTDSDANKPSQPLTSLGFATFLVVISLSHFPFSLTLFICAVAYSPIVTYISTSAIPTGISTCIIRLPLYKHGTRQRQLPSPMRIHERSLRIILEQAWPFKEILV